MARRYPPVSVVLLVATLGSLPDGALAQVTVPPLVMPRALPVGPPPRSHYIVSLLWPVAYPADVDLDVQPWPTAAQALLLGPAFRAQAGVERLPIESGPDGFGVLAGGGYALKVIDSGFHGFELHGTGTFSRAGRRDGSYRGQADLSAAGSLAVMFPAPILLRIAVGPVLRLRSAPGPGGSRATFLGGGLAGGLFGTKVQQRVGAQVTAEWIRIGDPYRGEGHHGDWRLAAGIHYDLTPVAD